MTPTATSVPATTAGDLSEPAGPGPVADKPSRTSRSRWNRWRRRVIVAAILIAGLGILIALALAARHPGAVLEPTDPGRDGGRAVAQVLRAHGVEVTVARSLDEVAQAMAETGGPTSIVMANPQYLWEGAAAQLLDEARSARRIVLVGVNSSHLHAMGLPALGWPLTTDADAAGPADCSSDLARDDDRLAGMTVTRYRAEPQAPADTVTCFELTSQDPTRGDVLGGSLLLRLPAGSTHPEIVLFGAPGAWTNGSVDEASNAGVALRTLGISPHLVWYQPGVQDLTASGGSSAAPVWPAWTAPALWLALGAFVLFAIAMGRRLGRLVPEPLPVVVPAAETTVSRGRLYRRAGDRARTARILRLGTLTRMRARLGRPNATVTELGAALATLSGIPAATIEVILAGPDPADDAALVRLAHDLTDLEEKVRHHD